MDGRYGDKTTSVSGGVNDSNKLRQRKIRAATIDKKVLPSDFSAGENFFVKVEDAANPTIFDVVEGYITATE